MLFDSEDLHVDDITQTDIAAVAQVYNSNKDFLITHMRTNRVTLQWVLDELESMKKIGFTSCKITEKGTNKIVGIIDFKVDEESYLSLLMIHKHYANRGLGKQVYKAFEKYAGVRGTKQIRLDAVTGYSDTVLSFWTGNGFHKSDDISLNWNGVVLPAVTMLKNFE